MTLYQDKYRIEPARFRNWDYASRGWSFVTICAQDHARIFGEVVSGQARLSQIGRIAESDLQTLHSHYKNVQVDAHVVMPNHIHAIIMIDGEHCFSPKTMMNLVYLLAPPPGDRRLVRSLRLSGDTKLV